MRITPTSPQFHANLRTNDYGENPSSFSDLLRSLKLVSQGLIWEIFCNSLPISLSVAKANALMYFMCLRTSSFVCLQSEGSRVPRFRKLAHFELVARQAVLATPKRSRFPVTAQECPAPALTIHAVRAQRRAKAHITGGNQAAVESCNDFNATH